MKTIYKTLIILIISVILGYLVTNWSIDWPIDGISIDQNISWCIYPSGWPFSFMGTLKYWQGTTIPTCAIGPFLKSIFILDVIFWTIISFSILGLLIYLYKKFKTRD